jgi:hypothetical protein
MKENRILKWLALAGLIFGLVTIVSGGRALFGSPEARVAVGQAVPFVLWFNFFAGFVYIVAGAGLLGRRAWGAHLANFLAVSTLLIFGAFGLHMLAGGAFESRTVGAMIVRSSFWIALALVARRALNQTSAASPAPKTA